MTELSLLIENIQKEFSDGCPNGSLLEWDLDRFFQPLQLLFSSSEVKNNTDFNYSYCNSLDIDLGKSSDGKKVFVMSLKISFIANVYTVYITEYKSNKRRGKVIHIEECEKYPSAIVKIRSFMKEQGFSEISDNDLGHYVENVDLELSERATVDKCLFDDFE